MTIPAGLEANALQLYKIGVENQLRRKSDYRERADREPALTSGIGDRRGPHLRLCIPPIQVLSTDTAGKYNNLLPVDLVKSSYSVTVSRWADA